MMTIDDIKKVRGKRKTQCKKLGIVALYKKYATHLSGLKYKEWKRVIDTVCEEVAQRLLAGEVVKLPKKMGSLSLRRKERKIAIGRDGQVIVNTPINWGATVRLWAEDESAREKKILIRQECKYIYSIIHTKDNIVYLSNTRIFYTPLRRLKLRLKEKIQTEGEIDCFALAKNADIWTRGE